MQNVLWDAGLSAANTGLPDAGQLVRRYLGLTEPRETWAFRTYDASRRRSDGRVDDDDLLAASSLGARLTRRDLEHFDRCRDLVEARLAAIPTSTSLRDASNKQLTDVSDLLLGTDLEPTLLAKIVHRARPRLIPPYDRATSDLYAGATGRRAAGRLPDLLFAMRADLQIPANVRALTGFQQQIIAETDGGFVPSQLRIFDIAVWMSTVGRR
ncbi:MAG: hypothetical protein EPO13_01145 [Actinomycetota bacterium]|nr:MAG: hypothetical protein EPO13_01145 [Actinomycetota bacterium]